VINALCADIISNGSLRNSLAVNDIVTLLPQLDDKRKLASVCFV